MSSFLAKKSKGQDILQVTNIIDGKSQWHNTQKKFNYKVNINTIYNVSEFQN